MLLQPSYYALKALLSHPDPSIREEGFDLLQDRATEFAENLIADFEDGNYEPNRFWFLELIVAAKVSDALPVLMGELGNPELAFRRLAAAGLMALGTQQAVDALVKAGIDPNLDPWEQEIPRQPR